jgi:apolipoprotein N-acyltransferase
MAAVRATELGLPMFRAAYTGVSAIIEPHGKIRERTIPFEKVSRVIPVRLGKVPTVYARWGDWFVFANAALVALAFAAHWRGRRR